MTTHSMDPRKIWGSAGGSRVGRSGPGGGKTRSSARMAAGAAMLMATLLASWHPASAAPTASSGAPASAASAQASGKVDVNSATATELASLPGIGDSKAAAIIAEREKRPFSSVEDLERVRGIGARTLEDLRSKVLVGKR